jgi:hypothetical protein
MAELLCAVEEGRQLRNGARGNLAGLALYFATTHAAPTEERFIVDLVRTLG